MRLWHLSPSVNSKHACAAIHWSYTSDFWSDPSSSSILYVCEQRRLWRDETARMHSLAWMPASPEPSLFDYVISTIISCAGSVYPSNAHGLLFSKARDMAIKSFFLVAYIANDHAKLYTCTTYMPYLTLWDKFSQNLANPEANSHKIFLISQNFQTILQNILWRNK